MNLWHLAIKHRYRIATVLLLVTVFCWFMAWVFHVPPNLISAFSGPDENLRMLIPKYIAAHGTLPTGYDSEAIGPVGNWSYAFYPQLLGAVVSAVFIKLASIFGVSGDGLIYAARLTSVLFGLISVYCVGKIAETVARYKKTRGAKLYGLGAIVLLAAWPQFAYLSSYVNNDVIAFAGTTLITLAVLKGALFGWNQRYATLLSAGIVVCMLGYTNSYGFIVAGVIAFVILLFNQKLSSLYRIRIVVCAAALPILIGFPFYIRNALIYKGDVTGISTFQTRTIQWERENNRSLQTGYHEITNASPLHMIFKDPKGRQLVTESFIGKFGYMRTGPELKDLWIYTIFLVVTICGAVIFGIHQIIQLILKKRWNIHTGVLGIYLTVSSLITLTLAAYYSYMIDFQPQGRYIIYLLTPLIIMWIYVFCKWETRVHQKLLVRSVYLLWSVVMAVTALTIYMKYIVV